MPGIFVSYRREDSAGWAGRLYDRLVATFGTSSVFMDVDTIAPGADYRQVIDSTLAQCEVVLAVIGRGWLSAETANGTRRLDLSNDLLRMELARALKTDVRVVPILVEDAALPAEEQLPEDLRPLAYRQAVPIRATSFGRDADALADALSRVMDEDRQRKEAAAAQAAEEEQRRLDAEAAAQTAAKEAQRQDATEQERPRTSAEQAAEREELRRERQQDESREIQASAGEESKLDAEQAAVGGVIETPSERSAAIDRRRTWFTRHGTAKRGLALAAGALAVIVALAVGFLRSEPESQQDTDTDVAASNPAPLIAPGDVHTFQDYVRFQAGQCLDVIDGLYLRFQLVGCDAHHEYEVFHTYDVTGGEYLAEADSEAWAAERTCGDEVDAYLALHELTEYLEGPWPITWTWKEPTRENWDQGDRQVVCYLAASHGLPRHP